MRRPISAGPPPRRRTCLSVPGRFRHTSGFGHPGRRRRGSRTSACTFTTSRSCGTPTQLGWSTWWRRVPRSTRDKCPTETTGSGCSSIPPRSMATGDRRGRRGGSPAAVPVRAWAVQRAAATEGARGAAAGVGHRDRLDRDRTGGPAGGLSAGGAGTADTAVDRHRTAGRRRGGRPQAQRRTPARRGVHGDRPSPRRAAVPARCGARTRHHAGTSDYRRAPPHRAHGAGVDHRTSHGRSP